MNWTQNLVLGFDTETTGLDPIRGRVLQFGLVVYDPKIGGFTDELLGECDTDGVPIDPGAQRAHGITADRVAGKPSFDARLPEIVEFLLRYKDASLLIYNAPFDLSFLLAACNRTGRQLPVDTGRVLDPLIIARRHWDKNRLVELAPRLGVSLDCAHDAGFDARASVLCMFKLHAREDVPADLDAAFKLQEETVLAWDRRYPNRKHWKQFETAIRTCTGGMGRGLFGG